MHTQVMRTSEEPFPGNSAAAETRLSYQSEIFFGANVYALWFLEVSLPSPAKRRYMYIVHACKFVVVKFEFAFVYT